MEGLEDRDPPLNDRSLARICSVLAVIAAGVFLLILPAARLAGQNSPFTLLAKDSRRSLPTTIIGGQEFVALDDLATAFQLTVREESGAITVSYKGRTIVVTPDQALASVAGRLVSLPAPPARAGTRWLVPVEFIARALGPIYDVRLDLRRPSHLVLIGDLRAPRTTVRLEPLANAARLTIDATPRAASGVTQEGNRLLVKFDADLIDPTFPVFQSQGLVAGIRLVDAVTIGIELGPRFSAYRASSEAIEDTTRLVIDLVGTDAGSSPATTGASGPAAPVAPPVDAAPVGSPPPSVRSIAVDAGHGGADTGVKGPGGTLEKDVTLSAARRLKAAIEARLGIRVLLTRDEDRDIPIDERVAIANNSKADLFISLHLNASLRGEPTGASIYVATFGGTAEAAPRLSPERVATFGGGSRDIEMVEWDRAQLRFLDPSTRMAAMLREEFQGRIPLDEHQPSDAAPFRVLESANMPAVLVEMGYLSNAEQEQRLAGGEFQNTLAQAILDAVVQFRGYLDQGAETPR